MALIDLKQNQEDNQSSTRECKLCSGNLIQMPKQLITRFKESILGDNTFTMFRCEECGSEYSLKKTDTK
jgi:uncharacterized protein with PIN domain